MSNLTIETVVVTPFQQNARVISSGAECVILDPGGDIDRILEQVGSKQVVGIVLTHFHIDHCAGVAGVRKLLGEIPIYAGEEKQLREQIAFQASYFGLSAGEYQNCPPADVLLEPGSRFLLLNIEWEARFTPGHSPGHFSFVLPESDYLIDGMEAHGALCLAGDALFRGSIGRTDLPGGDNAQLLHSISTQLLSLPDNVIVLPGHGELTTIGEERMSNPFLIGR
jgi:hydroxyacylglutathione hydrolase